MHRSKIQFTDYSGQNANFVWRGSNPTDCKISPGCANCYVDRAIVRSPNWPEFTTIKPDNLESLKRCRPSPKDVPYRRGEGSKPMVFVCDTGDLFHPSVPDWFQYHALDIFTERTDIVWQLLTKRANIMRAIIVNWLHHNQLMMVPENIWIGVTGENQEWADIRVSDLVKIPAYIHWLSYEPAIGPLNLTAPMYQLLSQIVCGGESGDKARPMHPMWEREVRQFCSNNNIAYFFKQHGEWCSIEALSPELLHTRWHSQSRWLSYDGTSYIARSDLQMLKDPPNDTYEKVFNVGRAVAGDFLNGVEYKEFPK